MNCIICNTNENLNIEISATDFNGAPVAIKLCETCGEDTTPKKAREIYASKQAEIVAFLEKAKSLGLSFNVGPGLAVAQQAAVPVAQAPVSVPAPTAAQARDLVLEEGEISASRYDAVSQNIKTNAVLGSGVPGGMSGYTPPVSALREMGIDQLEGKVKLEEVIGPNGMPIAIPKLRQDQMGTTTISIQRTDDAQLQRRFHELASSGDPPKAYERIRNCSFCNGDGHVRQSKSNTIQCPKCGGTGMLV